MQLRHSEGKGMAFACKNTKFFQSVDLHTARLPPARDQRSKCERFLGVMVFACNAIGADTPDNGGATPAKQRLGLSLQP